MINENYCFVFILGMHRSGTSCLAGCLQRCGLFMGNVSHSGRYNAKGNHELKTIHQLHDQILAMNKGSWYCPPEQIRIHPHHRHELEKISDSLSKQHGLCGVKDPRLLLLLDSWLEIITRRPVLVGTFRHPQAVAISLHKRNGIPIEDALHLWMNYNSKLVEQHQKYQFPIIEYDLSDRLRYLHIIEAIVNTLGLRSKHFQLRHFVNKKLEHHPVKDSTIPPQCREIYNYLHKNRFRS